MQVYRAKEPFTAVWASQALNAIVGIARQSFWRYGDVPLFDEYDRKALVYAIRAAYPRDPDGHLCEEWISVRFIPAYGEPVSTEDLENLHWRGQTLRSLLTDHFTGSEDSAMKSVVTISRLSAVSPYASSSGVVFETEGKLRYTALALTAALQTFFTIDAGRFPEFKFLTALFRPEITEKLRLGAAAVAEERLEFPTAHETLGLDPAEPMRINRSLLAYRFPGYFLSLPDLLRFLEDLSLSGRLPEPVIDSISHLGYPLEELKKACAVSASSVLYATRGLGRLLTWQGPIPGANLTGEELRDMLAATVGDGPTLRVMEQETFRKHVAGLIGRLGLSSIDTL